MSTHLHPYSDLSPDQVRRLIHAARLERAKAMRRFIASLFHWRRKTAAWTPAAAAAPALGLDTCR
jgi:hypothetical protein